MSSRLEKGLFTISCDHENCPAKYVCDRGLFKEGWKQARERGWTYQKDYTDNNIGKNLHRCPVHAEKHG